MIQAATFIGGARRDHAEPSHPRTCSSRSSTPRARSWAIPDVTSFLQAWLPIVFMGALVIARIRADAVHAAHPARPRSSPTPPRAIAWAEIAGADEAKEELREVVDYLRDPAALPRARREGAQGHPPARAARHRQDAAGQGRRPRVRAPRSSPSRRPRSSRCSSASAPPASATCSRPRARRRRRSCSSTSSTPSAATAASTSPASATRR